MRNASFSLAPPKIFITIYHSLCQKVYTLKIFKSHTHFQITKSTLYKLSLIWGHICHFLHGNGPFWLNKKKGYGHLHDI